MFLSVLGKQTKLFALAVMTSLGISSAGMARSINRMGQV